ncbi:LamG-like jellyroll fold domain-containing protein [Roseivirga pacifica]|uniref:LamG-like jellyroll fold domain-containing protein n=1 Tax=Roseivirga pacifica TaxID=1267423 RepID=UPI002095A2A2|nr:LamG-like jellyroll fold domain-containing protein [Roseivirga pacifica]MCO6358758.1 hypothetical protein [Roseivirga pacifica]MCO6365606.1 hypothetical protein [Roseivirga pacifica]MCO6371664.1 hypothetical protein [Roseivirga pacifica]MCO6376225.1 hypothetical protein [Roseivirga pacifica]MCO6379042.1 hypothetical protein [Roseivirga pacifica]
MSTTTPSSTPANPIFQYNFEAVNGQLTDLSGNGYDATVPTSGVKTTSDPTMGSCLQFLGTNEGYVTLPDLPGTEVSNLANGLTISMWVNPGSFAPNTTPVLLYFGTDNDNMSLRIDNNVPYYDKGTKTSTKSLDSSEKITAGNWVHLAVTVDAGGCATFYKDGVGQSPQTSADFVPTASLATTTGFIGKGTIGQIIPPFNGMMGWLAVYNGVLSASQILKEMALGQSNRHFVSNRSFPLDFKLGSKDAGADSPIMFIENKGDGENLDFHIINKASKSLYIPPSDAAIDAISNYHFQLRFRPGILSTNYVTKHTKSSSGSTAAEPLLNSSFWSTLLSEDSANNMLMSFLYTGDTSKELSDRTSKELTPGEELPLKIEKVNASATGGSKNTNVEFKYRGIDFGALTSSAPQIEGYRMQNISIVNHAGSKEISLRAEIVGVSGIMTYHKTTGANAPQNDLMFTLVNTDTDDLDLGTSTSPDGATTFTLSVDVQPENEFMDWALFAQGEGNPVVVLDVIGVVRSFDGTNTITLRSPLTTALDANTTIKIDGVSDTVTVGTNGAPAGAYTIPVTTNAQTIPDGAVITPTTGLNSWTLSPNSSVPAVANNQMQWTITNASVESFAQGKGLTFLLKGIECSLPAGSSTITIGYSNIPGHWDGSFALPVQKSPVAYNENLMGINTQEPKANLHIIEESGNVPFRVEKNKPEFPLVMATTDWPIGNLVWKEGKTFYDSTVYFDDNTNDVYLNIWTVDGTNTLCTSVMLPHESGSGGGVTPYGFAHWYNGYFYVISNKSGTINAYSLSGANATYKGSSNNSIPNNGGTFSPVPNIATYGDYLYSMDVSESSVLDFFDISGSSATQPQALNIDLSEYTGSYNIRQVLTDDSYVYLLGLNTLYINTVKPSGELHCISYVVYNMNLEVDRTNYVSAQIHGTFIYVKATSPDSLPYKSWVYVIDISDPTSLKQDSVHNSFDLSSYSGTINLNEQTLVFYENSMIVNSDEGLIIFDLSIANETNQPWLLPLTSLKTIINIGLVGGMFFVCRSTESNPFKCLAYDAEKTFANIFERNTFISSEAITIGAHEIDDKASISVPYPLSDSYNGIAIGDVSAGESAALSISASQSSVVDPVAINDSDGNPILNIKHPTAKGQPYRVGIGTDNPKAALHVASAVPTYLSDFEWMSGTKQGYDAGLAFVPVSIYTEHYMLALQYYANSDVRIKDVLNLSNQGQDLSTLLDLRVSNYQYIDFIGNGTAQKKGLIAQQVKEVFPQAVSTENTDFIPDIYAMATDVGWQPITRHLRVSLENAHDLAVGDIVRLIAEKGFEEKKVVAIPDDKSFVVAEWEKSVEKLFVFGKEVHDFHTVDYDQVAMLGVSAIQALHKKVEVQGERIDSLERENQSLKAALDELRLDLADFKTAVSRQYQN